MGIRYETGLAIAKSLVDELGEEKMLQLQDGASDVAKDSEGNVLIVFEFPTTTLADDLETIILEKMSMEDHCALSFCEDRYLGITVCYDFPTDEPDCVGNWWDNPFWLSSSISCRVCYEKPTEDS